MIRAIETRYGSHLFRSRLEARWAVFFDTLGVRYEYEKEGFELRSGKYLPDFWLPDQNLWVEIKGREPTELEMRLATELCAGVGDILVYSGNVELPKPGPTVSIKMVYMYAGKDAVSISKVVCCPNYWWCESSRGRLDVRALGIGCGPDIADGYRPDTPRLLVAYTAAQQARFEYGQVGAPSQWRTT